MTAPVDLATELAGALDRVVLRLRTSTAGRLSSSLTGPFASRADAARALAATLAVAAQGVEDAASPGPPVWRVVPTLPDLAVGDQVSVLGHDLVAALTAMAVLSAPATPSTPAMPATPTEVWTLAEIWTPDGRAPLNEVVRDVLAVIAEISRLL